MPAEERPSRRAIEASLDKLLDRVVRMSDPELLMLRVVWDEQDEIARTLAWRQTRAFVRARHLADLLESARSTLIAWANNAAAADYGTHGTRITISGSGIDPSAARREAMPPILDAVAATLARDGLEAKEQTALLEPLLRLSPRHQLA